MTIAPESGLQVAAGGDAAPAALAAMEQPARTRAQLVVFWIGMALAVGVPTYLVTYHFFDTYYLADSKYYAKFWREAHLFQSINSLDTLNRRQVLILGSQDPGYTLLIWLASRLDWTRDQFLALANAVACTVAAGLVYRKPSSLILTYGVLIYGYYLPAMMLTPERLRFGIYFAGLALLLWQRQRRLLSLVIGVLSVLVHVQVLLLYLAVGVYLYFPLIQDAFVAAWSRGQVRRWVWLLSGVGLLGGLWLLNINPQIQYKLGLYFDERLDPKVFLAVGALFLLRYFVARPGPFLTASSLTLIASFIAVGAYVNRTLVNVYILYLLDFFGAPRRQPLMWVMFTLVLAWTFLKTMGFYGSVLAGRGGYT